MTGAARHTRCGCQTGCMAAMKDRLQSDLTDAIRARDELTSATLRMALTAITNEEVSGKQSRELTDDDVMTVLAREAKKRRESAEAYDAADRPELAQRERDELGVLETYLPTPLTDDEVDAIIAAAVADAIAGGAEGGRAMGTVMKSVTAQISGRADGAVVAAKVRAALGMN
jgi:uncharacterized protein YqeY